jgi:Protein of unknown function (DUF3107)
MDVRIGVLHTMKEIEVELPTDAVRTEIRARIDEALGDDSGILWLKDRHGKDVAIPSARIAYIELSSPDHERRIGFGAA